MKDTLFRLVVTDVLQRTAANEDQIESIIQFILMEPIHFFHETAATVARHGTADFLPRHEANVGRPIGRALKDIEDSIAVDDRFTVPIDELVLSVLREPSFFFQFIHTILSW